jgi:hypothetical protein
MLSLARAMGKYDAILSSQFSLVIPKVLVARQHRLFSVLDAPNTRDVSFSRCRFFSCLDQAQLGRDVVQRVDGGYDSLNAVGLKRGSKFIDVGVVHGDNLGSLYIFDLKSV